jgi:hypothetical protein
MLMRYIFDRDLDKPAFRRKLKTLRNLKLSKNAMSLAEQFRQEGIRKGRQQGRQEGLVRANQAAILAARRHHPSRPRILRGRTLSTAPRVSE